MGGPGEGGWEGGDGVGAGCRWMGGQCKKALEWMQEVLDLEREGVRGKDEGSEGRARGGGGGGGGGK